MRPDEMENLVHHDEPKHAAAAQELGLENDVALSKERGRMHGDSASRLLRQQFASMSRQGRLRGNRDRAAY